MFRLIFFVQPSDRRIWGRDDVPGELHLEKKSFAKSCFFKVIDVYVAETASKGLRSSTINVTNISEVTNKLYKDSTVSLNAHCSHSQEEHFDTDKCSNIFVHERMFQ